MTNGKILSQVPDATETGAGALHWVMANVYAQTGGFHRVHNYMVAKLSLDIRLKMT